jgi:hypothetical protein
MKRGYLKWRVAAVAAASLLLCAAIPCFGDPGSVKGGSRAFESRGGKSIWLALKISGAKKKKRQVSFYKSVARQEKIRTNGDRTPSSGR